MIRFHLPESFKSILLVASLTLLFATVPSAAFGTSAANCTPTNCNTKVTGLDFGDFGINPCTGVAAGHLFFTGNIAIHGSADGTHSTGTFTGEATFTQANGVTYTGHITDWFGGNVNPNGASEFSGTMSLHASGSDGSSLRVNGHMHVTVTPAGDITAQVNPTGSVNCH